MAGNIRVLVADNSVLIRKVTEDKKRETIKKINIAKNTTKFNKECKNVVHIKEKNDIVESSNRLFHIVAIGTSTGGPKALQDVIPLIPGNVPAAFLVVQHMPLGFTKSLADRLNSLSKLTVKEAEDGEVIKPGHVYIAPGDFHMKVKRVDENTIKIQLSHDQPVGGHRPSVDVMMESLSDTALKNIVAVIMTGMGGDGSEGIKKIKKVNRGYIIAQDERTCVVYGMPKVAVQTGVVDAIIPLKEIAREILKILGVHT